MSEANSLSATDASNTTVSGINLAELCPAANINDGQRATLGLIARFWQRDHATATVGGTANSITLSYSAGNPASYVTGEKFAFIATASNTSTTAVNINSLGSKNVYRQSGSGPVPCVGGEIATGAIIELEYDGTQFQIVSGLPLILRGYLSGCVTSNNAGTPNTKIDVSAGVATDSTNAVLMTLAAVTINCATTGAAALDTGALANTTWYHVFVIAKADGTTSAIASTSASAPSPMPTGYTYKRRIGSFLTDGSAHIIAFSQLGDEFLWSTSVVDVNAVALAATAQTKTLTAPTGVQVQALIHAFIRDTGTAAATSCIFTALDETDQSAGSYFDLVTPSVTSAYSASAFRVRTNTSGQIRVRGSGTTATLTLATRGWLDDRGKLA